jgi:ADP-ribose pyrophosphatase YjhB (NUDIX family)
MLTEKELKQLTILLGKIDNPSIGLPQPVFDALTKIVPFIGCELAVVNDKKEVLLTWREDQWWNGWHFPGGLMRHNESIETRIQEVASGELGTRVDKYDFLFYKEYVDHPRLHAVSLVFLCTIDTRPKDGTFFKEMPRDIIDEHKELWEKVIRHTQLT